MAITMPQRALISTGGSSPTLAFFVESTAMVPVIASASVAKEKKTAKRKKALSILPCGSVESSAKIVLSMPLA